MKLKALTDDDKEFIHACAEGKSVQEMAARWRVSENAIVQRRIRLWRKIKTMLEDL
jgi:hypothetical protein